MILKLSLERGVGVYWGGGEEEEETMHGIAQSRQPGRSCVPWDMAEAWADVGRV